MIYGQLLSGGEGRIRTYVAEAADLQSAGINHSPTSPFQDRYFYSRMELSQHIFFMTQAFDEEKILQGLDLSRLDLVLYNTTTSTNDVGKEMPLNKEFLVISSDIQTKGRGRESKKWHSPSGNVCFSITFIEKDPNIPISLITGVIAQIAITNALNAKNIQLKWPNDLIYKNKKIGGILVEKEIEGSYIKTIVGIGINLDIDKKEPWWGDLSKFSNSKTRDLILNNLIKGFFGFVDGKLINWMDAWNKNCCHMNKIINIKNNNKIIENGEFIGISAKGALLLKKDNTIKEYSFGEISIEGIY